MSTLWDILLSITPFLWLPFPWFTRQLRMQSTDIDSLHPNEPSHWPKVSIIVAACNEEETITSGLTSLLQIDYPNLEVIVVNDRSTDNTKENIERFNDKRLRILHIETLPDGWLGKVHALHQGVQIASGEWLLFTDADIQFSKRSLKKCIALSIEKSIDHLTLLPWMFSRSLWAQMCISSALSFIAISQKPWRASNPRRKEAVGVGAFNLVRTEAFQQTAGFEWLRMEVADDIGLGHMMKQAHLQCQYYTAIDDVQVEWYPSLPLAIRGLEKNAFSQIAHFSLLQGLFFALALFILGSVPLFPLFSSIPPWSLGIAIFCAFFSSMQLANISRISIITLCSSFIFGHFILAYILLRSSIRGYLRGGIIWRDTVYPIAELKEGMRVHFITGKTSDE